MNNQSVKFAQIPLEVLLQRNNLKCRLITQGTEGVARFMLRIQIVIYQLIFEILEENCQGSNPLEKFF